MDKATLGYCAGIIDGEGSIFISKMIKNGKNYPTYQGMLAVRMTCPKALRVLQRAFGGSVHAYQWLNKSYKRYWHWCLYGEKAATTLRTLLPYLHTKKRQARLLLRFRKTVKGSGHNYLLVERQRRETLRLQMGRLNA